MSEQNTIKNLINGLSAITPGSREKKVRLIPILKKTGGSFSLSLKIGTDHTYVVKDILQLINSIKTGSTVTFSKNFTFDGSSMEFENAATGFINVLSVMVSENPSAAKEFPLKEEHILPLLCQLAGMEFALFTGTTIQKNVNLSFSAPPLSFDLSVADENYLLSCPELLKVQPLTSDWRVLLCDQTIFVPSLAQAKIIAQLSASLNGRDAISFTDEYKPAVIKRILPRLRLVGKTRLAEEVKKDVIVGELKVQTFLDITDYGGISATVYFCYGSRKFNHFLGETPVSNEKILLRDLRKENEFIRLAGELGFVPSSGVLYMNDEYKLYDFLSDGISLLKEMSEVFYSDRFNINVISPSRGNGGVSLSSGNILNFSLSYDGISDDELEKVMQSVKEKKKFYRLKSGSFVNLSSKAILGGQNILDRLNSTKPSGEINLSRAFFLSDYTSSPVKLSFNEMFDRFIQRFRSSDTEITIPEHIDKVLRPYQRTGVKWMKMLSDFGLGGILADEMGLGKTLQTIAFVMSQYEKTKKPTLIVVPTSLIFNWKAEIEKFAPEANVTVINGAPELRKESAEKMDDSHFVITSYGLLKNDLPLYLSTQFAYCFIDEAQHIKNPNTFNAKVVKQISADGFFALTGTPLENTLLELWSIFDFIMPGYLYTRHKFRMLYEVPIVKDKDKSALSMLKAHIRPFILRRLKTQVMAELPDKLENYLPSELTEEQKLLYLGYARRAKEEIISLGENGEFEKNRLKILAIITRLRQLCCHPALFVENYTGGSGKLSLLHDIVESSVAAGHRLLVFSQFTSMLGLISDMLTDMGISHYYLDGSTKSEDRFNMVKSFNEGSCDVFLVSLKAGGTGLNLTGADTVIHYDPWWNPAVENQATDRAHRIGQTKIVNVIKLIATGTIEEKICELKNVKQEMVDSVIETGETLLSSMTFEEIKKLFHD